MKTREPSIKDIATHLAQHENMSPKFALTRTLFTNCKVLLDKLYSAYESMNFAVNRYMVLEDRLTLVIQWVEERGGCGDVNCIGHMVKSESPSLYQCDACVEANMLLDVLRDKENV